MSDDKFLHISVNIDEVAKKLELLSDDIKQTIKQAIEALSVSTHAFIVDKAQKELKGWKRDFFLGDKGSNVRWSKVGDGIWMVELDPSVAWMEQGRPKTFQSWLLEGPNVKTNKKGEKYRVIPMGQKGLAGDKYNNPVPSVDTTIKNVLKQNKISLKGIEKNDDGTPKLGILHRVNFESPFTQSQTPDLFSKPRTPDQAALTGLKPHGGIHHLQGLTVTQRMQGKKVVREAITFRVIHEAHEKEGRWFAPEVKPLNFMQQAHEWALKQWSDTILPQIQEQFSKRD